MRPSKVAHPAKFSDTILNVTAGILSQRHPKGGRWLDPFAGTGKGCDFLASIGYDPIGIELEAEWANQSQYVFVGNALNPPNPPCSPGSFDGIFTSPVYGNRASDSHDAKEVCKRCKGTGDVSAGGGCAGICPKCGGEGRRQYKRLTYTHQLGRKLHPDNAGQLQWGEKYREFHRQAWAANVPMLRAGGDFILNCSDHIRNGELIKVTQFHIDVLEGLGLQMVTKIKIPTPRMRFGANGKLRATHEDLIVLQRP